MSFRDLRLLTENLRVLGYPTTVSLDSFREPNFKLVAGESFSQLHVHVHVVTWCQIRLRKMYFSELLIWLCGIYEPRVVIPVSIESEHDRINLIKTVSSLFITKQHIKLNTKKLYQGKPHPPTPPLFYCYLSVFILNILSWWVCCKGIAEADKQSC